ncbi:HAD family hydrolase [Veronia nyctiphanis]|nr:HAD family phosphatase [Veronia nyctiphanis]
MKNIELVIFDCDGVLVDSETITSRVFSNMLSEQEVNVALDDLFEMFVGQSSEKCVELTEKLLGCAPPEDFFHQLEKRVSVALENELVAIEGVQALLEALHQRGIAYCVASNGSHRKMSLTLGLTGLDPYFVGKAFSAHDVSHPKPAPDVFQMAAKTMNAQPENCLVVEDTPTGVKAGKAAGMTVAGFSLNTPSKRLEQAGADFHFSAMGELFKIIAK